MKASSAMNYKPLRPNRAPLAHHDVPAKFVAEHQDLVVQSVYVPFIGTISMAESKFYARCDLDVNWQASREDLKRSQADPKGYTPSFIPDIVSMNGMGVSGDCVPDRNGNRFQIVEGRNFMRVRFDGEFIESFEMESFPFDVQALTFAFGISFYTAEELRFTRPPGDDPFFFVLTRNSAFLEWTPTRLIAGTPVFENFSTLICQVQLKRDPTPYLLRIGVPCLTLNALQFTIFTSPEASERVNLALTLILTFVALIYTLTTLVPMAARATVADGYVLNSVGVAVLAIALSVGATYVTDGPEHVLFPGWWGQTADHTAIVIVGALQVLSHAQVLLSVLLSRRKEEAKLRHTFKEAYLDEAEKLQTMTF